MDLLWADPDNEVTNWNENDVAVSSKFGMNVLAKVISLRNSSFHVY